MISHRKSGLDETQIPLILDRIPVAITVTDLDGKILYYNEYSSRILDRKPEYRRRDIRLCHEKHESIARIDQMLEEFRMGRPQEFVYEADRYRNRVVVTLSPFLIDGRLIGCIQGVIIKPQNTHLVH